METYNPSWSDFDAAVETITARVRPWVEEGIVRSIWGIPRGGLVLAVTLSHRLNLPFLRSKAALLLVDDIADTGKTLQRYTPPGTRTVTWFYHHQSVFTPDVWVSTKTDKWIVFPWEAAP